jgi:hypothetical protein
MGPIILDACCGGRMFWFNKEHPNTIYMDVRKLEKNMIKDQKEFCVKPDVIADFRKMPFPDKSFKLVVFDPPHLLNLPPEGWPAMKYGSLNQATWRRDIKQGFDECMRVLEDHGVLIFKWSTAADGRKKRCISVQEVLKVIDCEPLFGHPSGSKNNTIWMTFMKIPNEVKHANERQG